MATKQSTLDRIFRNHSNPTEKGRRQWPKAGRRTPAKMSMEPLEPRVLLSMDTLAFMADAAHSDVTVRVDTATAEIIDTNTNSVLVSRALAETSGIVITGSEGEDTVRIDSSAIYGAPILFDGGEGYDRLHGPAVNSTWNITGDGAGSIGNVTFANLEDLIGAAGNEDTFIFADGAELDGIIDGGDGGFDTLITNSSASSAVYKAEGPTSGSVILDGNTIRYAGLEPITNIGTVAEAIFEASANADQILIHNDLLDPGKIVIRSENGTFEQVSVAAPATSLTVRGLGGNDTIKVSFLNFNGSLILEGGNDNDTIDTSLFGVSATLRGDAGNDVFISGKGTHNIDGGAGVDTVNEAGIDEFEGSAIALTDSELTITTATGSELNLLSSIERAVLAGSSINYSGFSGQVAFMQGVPEWEYQGPGAITNGYVRLGGDTDAERLVTGAVQDVAVHPTNPNIVYIASVNGGVWKTTDGGTIWEPLTDHFPTLSMSVIEIDLDNPNTIYAGTGRTSSYRNEGGSAIGVLKSTDGGQTWTVIAHELRSKRVTGIVAKGNIVLVTTDESVNGLWRSTDGGNTFTAVLGQPVDGIDNDVNSVVDQVEIVSVTPANGGNFYAAGDRLYFGSATFEVATVSGGVVTAVTVTSGGGFTEAIKNSPITPLQLSGVGNGQLTLNVTVTKPVEPMGKITDMVAEVVGGNLTVYVASLNAGIYRSADGGQTWTNINGDLPASLFADATRIRLAVSNAGNQPVYAAFVKPDAEGKTHLFGFYRVGDPSAASPDWTAMDLPGEDEAATDFDESIHPGGQANKHFSIVANPTNPNVVYVGGDTSPSTIGILNPVYTGNLWRGDASQSSGDQWTPLTNGDANDTAPHPDSRNMIFDSAGNILQVDDGGLYKLSNPENADTRVWSSMIGNLGLMEFSSVVYDPVNNVIIGGAQDNGVVLQAIGDPESWTTVIGGDGQVVGIAINSGASTLYFSTQHLGFFSRITNADPSSRIQMNLEVDGSAKFFSPLFYFDDQALEDFENVDVDGNGTDDEVPFGTRFEVNKVDPTRLLFGTRFLYETMPSTFDIDNIIPGFEASIDLDIWGDVAGTAPPVGTKYQLDTTMITTLAYGGYTLSGGARVGNADVAYAATFASQALFLRQGAGLDFLKTNWSKGEIRDIVLHPDDWRQIFVLTENTVWHGKLNDNANTGDIEFDWTDVTGRFNTITYNAQSIEVVQLNKGADPNNAGDDQLALVVGAPRGVFKTQLNTGSLNPATPPDLLWSEFGTGMPNILVLDVRYDTQDDILVAGTLGRGAWTMNNAKALLGVDSILTLNGRNNADGDDFRLLRDPIQPWLLHVYFDGQTTPGATFDLNAIGKIVMNGNAGDDTFEVDRTNGPIWVNGGIHIDGGAGSDDLELTYLGPPNKLPGEATYTAATSTWKITAKDLFGGQKPHTIHLTSIETNPTGEIALGSSQFEASLERLFDLASNSMGDSMTDQSVATLDTGSFIPGLGGSLIKLEDPSSDKSGAVVRTSLSGLALVDTGTNLLKRFLETGAGAFIMSDMLKKGPVALRDALQGLDPTGTVAFTNPGGTFDNVRYDVVLTKELSGLVDLKIIGDAIVAQLGGTFADALDFSGAIEISADITVDAAFGIDAGGFFLETGPDAEIRISNIQIKGNPKIIGRFGFLAVVLDNAQIQVEDGVELRFNISAPGDNLIRADELDELSVAFSIQSPGTPGTPDVLFMANLEVLVQLGEDTSFTVFDTNISLDWAEIDDVGFNLSTSGAQAAAALNFLKLSPSQLLGPLNDLKTDLVDLAGSATFDVPFMNVSFSGLLDVFDTFDERVLSHLQIGSGTSFLTAQGLATVLASSLTDIKAVDEISGDLQTQIEANKQNVLRTLADLGLKYNASTGDLTYDVNIEKSFELTDAFELGFDLPAGIGDFNVDAAMVLQIRAKINLTLGINLNSFGTVPILQSIFIRDASLRAEVEFFVDDLDATARLGFLNVQVVNGKAYSYDPSVNPAFPADLNASKNPPGSVLGPLAFEIGLSDPDGNNSDSDGKKISLKELFDNLDSPGNLIGDPTFSGGVILVLPLAASFLGISASDNTTLIINIPDIGDLGNIIVTEPAILTDLQELFNFDNMSAGELVSLIAGLSDQLQDLRDSQFFTDLDIPFVEGAITDVLDFADSLSEGLLFDDGADNTTDGANRLAFDLNSAFAAAELGQQIVIQGTGTGLKFVAIDHTITGFKVEVGAGDAGGFATLGVSGGGSFALTHNATPSASVLAANAVIKITLQRGSDITTHDVTLKSADTTNNTGIGDDTIKLVRGDKSPTFDTTEGLAFRIAQILNVSNAVLYDKNTDALTVNIGALLPRKSFTNDYPIDFDLDLGSIAGIESNSIVRVQGSAGLNPNFIFGVYLGETVPGAISNLALGTNLTTLNDNEGVDIKTEPAITAPAAVSQIHGRLQSDATFTLEVTANGATTLSSYTLKAADTLDNMSTANLASDLTAALGVSSVRSGAVDTYALPGDAVFTITIGGTAYTVTVTAASTATNTLRSELVTDIITALQNAKDGGNTVDLTGGTHLMTAVQEGAQIVLKRNHAASDSRFTLGVTAGNNAETILKLPAGSTTGLKISNLVTGVAAGDRLGLIAAPTVVSLKLTANKNDAAVKELGFLEQQTAKGPYTGSNLDNFVLEQTNALFKLQIAGITYDVTVTTVATAGNASIGALVTDVNNALKVAKNTSNNATVDLSSKIVAEASGNALRFKIVDANTASIKLTAAIDNPAVFDLGLTDEVTITLLLISAVKDTPLLVGRLATDATFNLAITGVNGGAPIPVTIYSDDTSANTTILSLVSDVNQALQIASLKGAAISSFVLGANVTFSVALNGASPQQVTVLASETTTNTTFSDLILDINKALETAGLKGLVVAKPSGTSSAAGQARIRLEGTNDAITRLQITAPAGNALGLSDGMAYSLLGRMEAESIGNKLIISAVDSLVVNGAAVGSFVLGSDAVFKIQIAGESEKTVTIDKDDTTTNTRIEHLVRALNIALGDALDGRIHAEVNGNAIILRSMDPAITGFTITQGSAALGLSMGAAVASKITGFTMSGPNLPDLGFPTLAAAPIVADSTDLLIYVSNPGANTEPYRVTLDGLPDIQAVKNAIQIVTSNKVTVQINEGKTGLTLIDNTFIPVTLDQNGNLISNTNTRTFMVSSANGSAAGVGLGIVGLDSLNAANLDGKIDGGQISGIKLTDRFFIQNASVSADLTVSTPQLNGAGQVFDTDGDGSTTDGIDAIAHFGFVEVSLTGGGSITAKIEASLLDPTLTGPANDGRITLTEFIDGLSNIPLPNNQLPANTRKMLELPRLTGGGDIDLKVEVEGVPFINPTNAQIGIDILNLGDIFDHYPDSIVFDAQWASDHTFTIQGDQRAKVAKGARVTAGDVETFVTNVTFASNVTTVTITSDDTLPTPLNSVTIGTPLAPAIDFHFTGLDDLLAFQNPEFGLSAIIDALIMLSDFLSQFDAIGGALNAPIPLVNVSVNDLLSFADKLADALDNFQNDPAGSLQVLDTKISEAFGVDPASNLLVFQLDNFGTPNNSADDILKIQLNLSEGFNKSLNVQIPGIDLGLPAPFDELVDFSGAATLAATGSASLSLHMGIGLNDPEKIYLYNSSGLTGNLTLSGSDMAFRAGLGPFSLSIVDGEASIAGNLSLDFTGAPAQLFDAGGRTRLDTAGALSNVLSALNPDLSAPINVTLPIFFPTESNGLGDITLTGDLTNVESGFVVKTTAGQTVDADAIVLDVSEILDGLLDAFENMGLLDQILFVIDGVDMVLGGVQDALDGEILGFELPLVGDSLADGAHFIQDFRNDFLADFRDGVEQLADPNDDAIKTLLFNLLGDPGLKLLKKANGDVGGTLDDIQKFTNLDTASDVSSSEIWWKFKIGESKPIPNDIGFDIGIPGLGLKTEGDIVFTLGWELDFGFGLSGSDGFFFFIDDPDELKLFIDVTLPNASLTGTLGFLEFTAANKDVNNDGDQTHLSASFAINIVNTLKADDTRLGLSELGRLGFEALVGAEASVELGMTLGLSGDNGGFPEIQADFILDWKIDGDPGVSGIQAINLFNPPASFDFGKSIQSGLERVEFLNVKLDLGSYITEVVGPLVREIKDTTEPVQPIIDIVTTPLPVLSDLGLDITLLDIAKQTGLVDPRLIDALEIILQVVTVINDMEMPDDGSLLVPFGNFTVFDRNNDLFDGLTNFDLGSADFDLDKFSEQILGPGGPLAGLISGLPSGLQDVIGEVAGVAGDIMKGLADKSGVGSKKPFTFPIIEDPSQIFGLLMGTPAVLVAYDMPPLHFEAEFSAFFSIFGPLGVSINLEAELNIDFAFGYDTKGFTDFADSGFKNPLLLANGLFVSDDPTDPTYDGGGDDPPELTFNGGLWAAAELNLGIARGGVGGGIFIDVDFNLFDPDGDGRVRLDELLGNFLNQLKAPEVAERFLAPLAIFDVHGKITAELFAFLKIDFEFFEIDKTFDITPPVTLVEFDVDFFRPPVLATELDNGDLLINIGDFAAQRVLGDTTDFGEHIFIADAGPGKVAVWSDNLEDAGADAKQIYSVSGKIIAVGGEGDDVIDLSGVGSAIRYDIEGGVGQDILKGSSGGGIMKGGAGDDTLLKGGSGSDIIFGNEGKDIIEGGAGNDLAFGDDGELPAAFNLASPLGFVRALFGLTDGDDTISGEGGDDILIGSGGIDTINGGAGNDLIIGDSALLSFNSPPVVTESDDDPQAFGDILKGGANNDIIYGGQGNDDIEGEAGDDIIYGQSGKDDLDGGTENDTIFGDSGRFILGNLNNPAVLVGGDSDLIHGGAGNDKLLGGGGSDQIYGEAGDDRIEGGTGADFLYGGTENDTLHGGSDPDQLFGDAGNDTLEGGQGNDIVKGGTGVDRLIAGYGSDILDGEIDSDQYQINARGGTTTELTTIFDSGSGNTDILTVLGTGGADVFLLRAMADSYFPKIDKKLEPALERAFIKIDLLTEDEEKHELIRKYIIAAYGPHEAPQAMLDALDAVDLTQGNALDKLKEAVNTHYVTEQNALQTDTDTAFVALLNNGGANVERFNYRNLEGLVLNTVGGADLVVTDDVMAATTINLGTGDDRVQVGQVFRSERSVDDPPVITHIDPQDVFMTIEITRGWLSNGVSVATTINGGDGNDEFTVFHNIAALNLNGGAGDDLFTVRAFALAGSTDSERGRTDMKGDAGADTILYAVNAPVGIDGGDGFDTVRIIGTEFSDDFVVTDAGVFGAGLNVSYVNIEKLVADAAEGDDRFFVLSTGIEVVTELDGGLGNDSFFVGGSPGDAPIPVISNDLRGHSGIILHSIETGAPEYQGIAIDGVSANVADNEEDFIVVTLSGGSSRVTEGATVGAEGWVYDFYTVRLTRKPDSGKTVIINIVPAALPPEDEAMGFRDLEFYDPYNLNTLLPYVNGKQQLPVLTFNSDNDWNTPQIIKFRAVNDTASEGIRQVFINHTTSNSTDALYSDAKMLSVKVQINDDDRAGVIITPSQNNNTLLEGGFTDQYDIVLTRQPVNNHTVTVNLTSLNGQVQLSNTQLVFSADPNAANAWNKRQTITLTAIDDNAVEGFHTDFISYTVTSLDGNVTKPQVLYQLDGDPDQDLLSDGLPDDIPEDKPVSFMFLSHRPLLNQPIQILHDPDGDAGILTEVALSQYTNETDQVLRYAITGNTLEFFKGGAPIAISGKIRASFSYVEPGYNGALVRDTSIDIYDNDAPAVIIRQSNGSTDVMEGSLASDSYTVTLSKAPSAAVTVTIDAVNTRTTLDGFARFQEQVEVSTNNVDFFSVVQLTFTEENVPQTIWVRAKHDTVLDGSDTQVFAPEAHTVSKIRGPLMLEGAAGSGSLSLPAPLMLPGELNVRPSDGLVKGFTAGTGEGAFEFMNVRLEDLNALINDDTKDFDSFSDFIDKTVELTEGPGTAVVLDSTRPRDLFDRFWLIKEVQLVPGDATLRRLKLQNPTMVNPGLPNVIAPVANTTKYAITNLSVNFFVDEKLAVDYVTVYDEDSVANRTGRLTSADGNVLGYNAANNTMLVETADLQALAGLLGIVNLNTGFVGKTLDITVGPGLERRWTIQSVVDADAGVKRLTLLDVSGSGTPTDRSEYRIAGGDRKGRITGFGMGPNVIIGTGVQPGGITYGDIEVLQMGLGLGNDTVVVDYTTNAEDHTSKRNDDFYTLTLLNTGAGNDNITVKLDNGDDGSFALNTEGGDDTVNGSGSLGVVMFGGLGNDTLTGGSGEDLIFGDIGRVDYLNATGEIVTRLGHTVPQSPVNPPVGFAVSSATSTTITNSLAQYAVDSLAGFKIQVVGPDGEAQLRTISSNTANVITVDTAFTVLPNSNFFYRILFKAEDKVIDGIQRATLTDAVGNFETAYGGLVGLGLQVIAPNGRVQFRQIISNTATELVLDKPWDVIPVASTSTPKLNFFYRVASYPEDQTDGAFRGPRIAWSINETLGGNDTINGGAGRDLLIGGVGADTMHGDAGDDLVAGDNARFDYLPVTGNDGPTFLRSVQTTAESVGGSDTIFGDAGDDVLIGGVGADNIDGGSDQDLIFGDNVNLVWNAGSGDAIDPRFRTLAAGATTLYDLNGVALVAAETSTGNPVPGTRPAWADWTFTLDPTSNNFGNDYIAGGAGNDEIFGQLGDDTIQGDGSILSKTDLDPQTLAVSGVLIVDNGVLKLVAPSFEAPGTDGDDYIEGNGGSDVIFGNLGQDDIIGGTSDLFRRNTAALRSDDSDIIFGGAGTDISRNNLGEAALNTGGDNILTDANGHSRDADMILGDNGDIFRLVTINGAASYLGFSYDDLYGGSPIIPRVARLLDYTPGGPDFSAAAGSDIGAADQIHGESGDDFIYGMKGADFLYGDGQDDDIIGGYGNDWISGGTGDDGVIGDDGRIYTSRNGVLETLYGITATTQTDISTPGKIQTATINVAGQLKKTVNLTPFSADATWPATNTTDEFGGSDTADAHPHNSDDIIYGGWGNDFLHGGTGDDAISGAEALADFFHAPSNPGDVLAYAELRASEFALYDEFNPLARIAGFLLNFSASEGVKVGTVNGTTFYSDGNDAVFGDTGNDWLVGGTGRDNLYGGWGDDLLNADDNLDTNNGLNNAPDTHTTYEDRAYGGAGIDVLIGNTGGDRLIDWVGEFNSYLVPFSPFGNSTISRTVQPQLPEFLYALAASDGADPTRDLDNSRPATDPRNGEPFGELGLVLQQDFSWQEQTGAPNDEQSGNIPGGKRDVVSTSTFNDNQAEGFVPDTGTWTVKGGRYQVAPEVAGGDAVSVYYVDSYLPNYFEMLATINAVKPQGGTDANAYVIFDYQSPTNFKFAGVNVSTNQLEIGHRDATGWIVDKQTPFPGSIKSNTDYNMFLAINGTAVQVTVNNVRTLTHTYAPRVDVNGVSHGLSHGMVGLGAKNAVAQIDNVAVQVVPPFTTLNKTIDFSSGTSSLLNPPLSGSWSLINGRYEGTATASTIAVDLTPLELTTRALLELSAKLRFSAGGEGGFIYDQYGPQDFKFVTISAGKITLGHRTAKGWFIDLAVNNNTLVADTDYTIGLTLKGTTISVTLNGQLVASRAYNAVVTDGAFGLFSRAGTTSFDTVTIKTDDPNLSGESFALTAVKTDIDAASGVSTEFLNAWLSGLDSSVVPAGVSLVVVNDLPGDAIAWNVGDGTILIEATAAGYGWFIDPTPMDSSEFQSKDGILIAPESSPAYGHMDLLTAVMHEIGHLLGQDHGEGELMEATLSPGERKTEESVSASVSIDWSGETVASALTADRGRGLGGFPEFGFGTSDWVGTDVSPKKKRTLNEEVEWLIER